jgi:hypothetical protein
MQIAGLDQKVADLVDLVSCPLLAFLSRLLSSFQLLVRTVALRLQVYINAPYKASGPPPPDVPQDLFGPPWYEWWNAKQVPALPILKSWVRLFAGP